MKKIDIEKRKFKIGTKKPESLAAVERVFYSRHKLKIEQKDFLNCKTKVDINIRGEPPD